MQKNNPPKQIFELQVQSSKNNKKGVLAKSFYDKAKITSNNKQFDIEKCVH